MVVKLTAAIAPTQMNILTMAIKKELQNVAFRSFFFRFSNNDFFLIISPLKDDELAKSKL